ncbi:hypothetical protein [Collimonas sp. OK307]|uniref:hypothetical protein n=1 Tax=Collimonas sp. OK307 TaxID=1801620 RepID=UPI0011139280|nr:hypothetical protein [Collimonas sp. OK307]
MKNNFTQASAWRLLWVLPWVFVGLATKAAIFRNTGGCRDGCLMYNSNFPHVPFGTFRND